MGFIPLAIVELVGHSSRISMMAAKRGVAYIVVDVFSQAVSLQVGTNQDNWICIAVYASPTPSFREML